MLFGLVLGSAAALIAGARRRACLRQQHPGDRDLPLMSTCSTNRHLASRLVTQLGELGDVGLGGVRIAGAGGAKGTGEIGDRRYLSQRAGADHKLG